jgi:hypothetical protein
MVCHTAVAFGVWQKEDAADNNMHNMRVGIFSCTRRRTESSVASGIRESEVTSRRGCGISIGEKGVVLSTPRSNSRSMSSSQWQKRRHNGGEDTVDIYSTSAI